MKSTTFGDKIKKHCCGGDEFEKKRNECQELTYDCYIFDK